MLSRCIFALLLTSSLAIGARADLAVGTFAPDIEAKGWLPNEEARVSLVELRGMIVVLYFWVSFHGAGEAILPSLNILESQRTQGVFVVGVTEAEREQVEKALIDAKVQFPVAYGSDAAKDYEIGQFPWIVMIDPDGKVAWTGAPSGAVGEAYRKILRENPPNRTHPAEALRAREELDRARAALREDNYLEAFEAARDAFDRTLTGDDLKSQCQEMLDLIEAIARDHLAEADAAVESKDYDTAVRELRMVIRRFKGIEPARQAKEDLEKLQEKHPEIGEIVKGQHADAEARSLVMAAREDVRQQRFGPGFEKLERVVNEFADSQVVEHAQGVLDRMRRNATVMGAVRDHKAAAECTNLLAQARSFAARGDKRRATELLRKVLRDHPETRFAAEAQQLLIGLQ